MGWRQRVLLLSLPAAGLAAWRWSIGVGKSRLVVRRDGVHFPTVSGFNLLRQELEFPRDFAGALNVLFVPFLQNQQPVVDTWVPLAQALEADLPGVAYYELPTIDRMPLIARTFINEGMRAGIPDETARARTVTLYVDTAAFRQAVGIPSRDDVHTLLVDRDGWILWRATGRCNEAKAAGLRQAIEDNLSQEA